MLGDKLLEPQDLEKQDVKNRHVQLSYNFTRYFKDYIQNTT